MHEEKLRPLPHSIIKNQSRIGPRPKRGSKNYKTPGRKDRSKSWRPWIRRWFHLSLYLFLSNNQHLLSHLVSAGQEFRSGLAGPFGFEVSCEIVVKMLTRAAGICRLDWLRICFQDGPPVNAAGEEELAVGRGLSSSPCDLIHGAA